MKYILLNILSWIPTTKQRSLRFYLSKFARSYFHFSAIEALFVELGVEKAVYLDVGARRGVDSKHLKYKKYLEFVLFEPDPNECDYLSNFYVDVRNVALSSKSGTVDLNITEDPGGSYTSNNLLAKEHYTDDFLREARITGNKTGIRGTTKVSTLRLDQCNLVGPLLFLKLDVQGEELSVLNGLGKLRPACLKIEISSEASKTKRSQLVEILEWARNNDYKLAGASFSDKSTFHYQGEFETSFQGDYYFIDGGFKNCAKTQGLVAAGLIVLDIPTLALAVLAGNPIANKVKYALEKKSRFQLSHSLSKYNNAHDKRRSTP